MSSKHKLLNLEIVLLPRLHSEYSENTLMKKTMRFMYNV